MNLTNHTNDYLYSGLTGLAMRYSHWCLRRLRRPNGGGAPRVLEIGSGFNPHFINAGFDSPLSRIVLSERREVVDTYLRGEIVGKHSNLEFHVWEDDPLYSRLKESEPFDIILASHVLEHIPEPQVVLKHWMELLAEGGFLYLACPCDPGLLWRTGQLISRRKAKKILGLSGLEYDYYMACEHINSIGNILRIARYLDPKCLIEFRPFKVKIVSANLFCFIVIEKRTARML
jgi:phosphatidylethanolamine/phosphatidyl-N-methylethanolamine N-methyltransferase